MNFVLLGATGRTGRLVAQQALARGHDVTAITRIPETVGAHGRMRTVVADPRCVDDLEPALADNSVVISCLSQKSAQDADLLRRAATATLEGMGRTGIRRYLVVSQGLLFPSRNPIIALLRLILARHVADSTAMEQLVRASNVEWTIVRPPRLKEGGSPHGYRVRRGARPQGAWAMQRVDLAAFLLDEAEKGEHKNAIVGITSA